MKLLKGMVRTLFVDDIFSHCITLKERGFKFPILVSREQWGPSFATLVLEIVVNDFSNKAFGFALPPADGRPLILPDIYGTPSQTVEIQHAEAPIWVCWERVPRRWQDIYLHFGGVLEQCSRKN